MMRNYYTGVGSRETPPEILSLMTRIAAELQRRGYILRSGGADGADSAFEAGASEKEIYLPWKGFNNSTSPLYHIPAEAYEVASQIHPAWEKLKPGAKKLHARNVLQVLGQELNKPSKLLVCWTKDGKDIGGTRTAIVLARSYNVPIVNLAIDPPTKIRDFL